MSVLQCNRKGCNNIMCDRHSHRYGYICDECFEELISLEPKISVDTFTNFMQSVKQEKEPGLLARTKCEDEFPIQ